MAKTSTRTATEVRSPTSTKTSTEAYTQGNFTATVTGGAGSGDTHVTIHTDPLAGEDKKMKESEDLMSVLGTPPAGAPGKKGGYLDGKSPELRTYLEQAVDTESTPEARAEALCRAIEFSAGGGEEITDVDMPMGEETYE